MDINTVIGGLTLIAVVATLYYGVRTFNLQEKATKKTPDIRILFGQQKPETQEPVNIFAPTGLNVATAPRLTKVFAFNLGGVATGTYRLSIFLPNGIDFVPSATVSHGTPSVVIDEEKYSEALIESKDSIDLGETPREIARFELRGLAPVARVRWRLSSKDYETEGHVRIALP